MHEICLLLALNLFAIGICGVLSTQNNLLFMLMAIEIMLLASNILLISNSVFFGDFGGQVFALLVLTVAASESAVGLALIVLIFKSRGTIAYSYINLIKG